MIFMMEGLGKCIYCLVWFGFFVLWYINIHELFNAKIRKTVGVLFNPTQKTCRRQWTIGKSGERWSRISVLAARHDDDDEEFELSHSACHNLPHLPVSHKDSALYCLFWNLCSYWSVYEGPSDSYLGPWVKKINHSSTHPTLLPSIAYRHEKS